MTTELKTENFHYITLGNCYAVLSGSKPTLGQVTQVEPKVPILLSCIVGQACQAFRALLCHPMQ